MARSVSPQVAKTAARPRKAGHRSAPGAARQRPPWRAGTPAIASDANQGNFAAGAAASRPQSRRRGGAPRVARLGPRSARDEAEAVFEFLRRGTGDARQAHHKRRAQAEAAATRAEFAAYKEAAIVAEKREMRRPADAQPHFDYFAMPDHGQPIDVKTGKAMSGVERFAATGDEEFARGRPRSAPSSRSRAVPSRSQKHVNYDDGGALASNGATSNRNDDDDDPDVGPWLRRGSGRLMASVRGGQHQRRQPQQTNSYIGESRRTSPRTRSTSSHMHADVAMPECDATFCFPVFTHRYACILFSITTTYPMFMCMRRVTSVLGPAIREAREAWKQNHEVRHTGRSGRA
eukprot:SAG31_NODE_83_length_27039_cov_14.035746_9_plen_347_part_00